MFIGPPEEIPEDEIASANFTGSPDIADQFAEQTSFDFENAVEYNSQVDGTIDEIDGNTGSQIEDLVGGTLSDGAGVGQELREGAYGDFDGTSDVAGMSIEDSSVNMEEGGTFETALT